MAEAELTKREKTGRQRARSSSSAAHQSRFAQNASRLPDHRPMPSKLMNETWGKSSKKSISVLVLLLYIYAPTPTPRCFKHLHWGAVRVKFTATIQFYRPKCHSHRCHSALGAGTPPVAPCAAAAAAARLRSVKKHSPHCTAMDHTCRFKRHISMTPSGLFRAMISNGVAPLPSP